MTAVWVILSYTMVQQICKDKHTWDFCPISYHWNAGISLWRPVRLFKCKTSGRRSSFLQMLWSSLMSNIPKYFMPSKLCTIAAHLSIIKHLVFTTCLFSCMLFVRGYEGLTTRLRGKEMQGNVPSCWMKHQDRSRTITWGSFPA